MRPARLEGARRGRRMPWEASFFLCRGIASAAWPKRGKPLERTNLESADAQSNEGSASGSSSASGTPVAMSTTHRWKLGSE